MPIMFTGLPLKIEISVLISAQSFDPLNPINLSKLTIQLTPCIIILPYPNIKMKASPTQTHSQKSQHFSAPIHPSANKTLLNLPLFFSADTIFVEKIKCEPDPYYEQDDSGANRSPPKDRAALAVRGGCCFWICCGGWAREAAVPCHLE